MNSCLCKSTQANSKKLIIQLQEYRDKCFIYNILCDRSASYYSNIKNIINLPLIISSSIMTILNSGSFNSEDMKIPNITLNAMTVLLMSLTNNFKVVEKNSQFKNLSLKYLELLHYIEDKLNEETIDGDDIKEISKMYDNLIASTDYSYPNSIKTKVKKIYGGKRFMPNILNCETDFINNIVIEGDNTKLESNIVYSNKTPRVLDVKEIK